MNEYIFVYLFAIAIVVGYIYTTFFSTTLIYEKSTYDGRSYLVRNLPDKHDAANLLALTRERLMKFSELLEEHYPNDKRVLLLIKRYKPDNIQESEPSSKYTSYTINKGEKIIYCLRSRDAQQKLIDKNTLLFVALHELSHVMTVSVDHSTEFWENFRFVLANAIHWKIYVPQDFEHNPKPYCGTMVTNSPLKLTDIKKYVNYDEPIDEQNEASIK